MMPENSVQLAERLVSWELPFRKQSIMAVKNNFPKQPPLSMAIQAAGTQKLFPQGRTILRMNSISWAGKITPTDYARSYTVELRYKMGSQPQVWVREPNLQLLAGERKL